MWIHYSFTYSTWMVFPMPICYVKSCSQQKCRVHNLMYFYMYLLLFGEIRNLTSLTRSIHNNNGFSISSFYLSILCILWIGAQFPQEKFLSYGRILTSYYYFILMCILVIFENKIIRCHKIIPTIRSCILGFLELFLPAKI